MRCRDDLAPVGVVRLPAERDGRPVTIQREGRADAVEPTRFTSPLGQPPGEFQRSPSDAGRQPERAWSAPAHEFAQAETLRGGEVERSADRSLKGRSNRVRDVVLVHALQARLLLETGLWLETMFVQRLAQLAYRARDPARRTRYLQEIREEAGHSLMFVELLHRSKVASSGKHGFGVRLAEGLSRTVPSRSALFWAMVVLGEELPDRLSQRLQRGVEDVVLSAVVYRVAQIHSRDEAAHAGYARAHCEEATRRLDGWQRALLSPLLQGILHAFARHVYFPPAGVYDRAGLVPAARWRARALRNPARRAQVGEMLRPTLEFLRRIGWRVSSRYVDGN